MAGAPGPELDDIEPIGLGTWQNTDADQCAWSVSTALDIGFRHVDTAQIYGNERAVGTGIGMSEADEREVFVATKVWVDRLGGDDLVPSARRSRGKLGVEQIDLLYVHWPAGDYDPGETLPAMAKLVDDGYVRHVGVSNFTIPLLEQATEVWGVEPYAHQFEMHPLLPNDAVREYCLEHAIHPVAYSPLARGAVFEESVIAEIADDRGVSPARVSLAWCRQKGAIPIPKATGEAHIRDDWASLDLELDDDEVARIDAIETRARQVDPAFGPW